MSCPASGGAEMEAGAPVAGTAAPGCPACPSPSILASFPIASGKVSSGRKGGRRWFYNGGKNSDETQRYSPSAIITYNSASCTEHARWGRVRERADVMGGNFCGPYVRVLEWQPPETNSRDNPILFCNLASQYIFVECFKKKQQSHDLQICLKIIYIDYLIGFCL